jgi:hypothetical protein
MHLTQPLMMISEVLRSIMDNHFQIKGGAVREEELNNTVTLQFGFYGPNNFENQSRLDFFAKKVADTVAVLNAAEADDNHEGPPSVQYDAESRTLFAENPAHYADFLEQFSKQHGLGLDVPVTALAGFGPDFKLTDHFRAQAKAALQNPETLKSLETNRAYNGTDDLYRAVLAAQEYGKTGPARPLYSLGDIRAAFRTEDQRTAPRKKSDGPTLWMN